MSNVMKVPLATEHISEEDRLRIVARRALAPIAPPGSGASTKWEPVSDRRRAMSRLAAGRVVDRSTRIDPSAAAPAHSLATAATASGVGKDVNVTSLAFATSPTDRTGARCGDVRHRAVTARLNEHRDRPGQAVAEPVGRAVRAHTKPGDRAVPVTAADGHA